MIGGARYTYAHRGDGQLITETVPGVDQRRALSSLLKTLSSEALLLPEHIASLIPPRPYGYGRHRELFKTRTAPLFDRLAPVDAAAYHTTAYLLDVHRANRLVQQHALDKTLPGVEELLDAMISNTWKKRPGDGFVAEVERVVQGIVLERLFALGADEGATSQVKAFVAMKVRSLGGWMRDRLKSEKNTSRRAHLGFYADRISRFIENPKDFRQTDPVDIPPGQPIGMREDACSWGGMQ
jgi:hypothetical protein